MPIVDMKGVQEHAKQSGYTIGGFPITDLESINHAIHCAAQLRSPLVLSLNHSETADIELLAAATERAAERSAIPVVLHHSGCTSLEQAIEAIRFGCNSLAVAPSASALTESITEMAQGCGVTVTDLPSADASCSVEQQIEQWGSSNQADAVLQHATPWAPVEHLIIFNADASAEAALEMMKKGEQILAALPGVRRVFIGDAIQDNAKYRFTWVIRFCHPAVIDSYRDHPAHVAFADELFRPVAGDRISIDYLAV